jgi:hypothetical protein
MQTEQPVMGDSPGELPIVRNHVGPSTWTHSRFRVSLEGLRKVAKRPGQVTTKPVEEINRYCEWVETVGDPNRTGAISSLQEMFQVDEDKAKSILSNANLWADRIKMPVYYRRMSWSTRPREHKEKESTSEPRKSDIVFGDARFAHLEEEQRRLDSLLKDLADVMDDNVIKVVKGQEDRLERAEHRLQVLDESLNKMLVALLAKGEAIAELQGKMALVENKLRGVRKSPRLLTKFHREVRRRLRVLIAGGK